MIFIDTNYFLRYLLNDVSDQYQQVKNLFLKGSEGKVSMITSPIVFFEIFWVLRSFYRLNKQDCIIALRNVLKLSFIYLEERNMLTNALMLFEKTNLDLEDCYNLYFAKSQKVETFGTFGGKLNLRIIGVLKL
jgi:predicted nucleic-acid-binding protein